jgi:hypothetical protein
MAKPKLNRVDDETRFAVLARALLQMRKMWTMISYGFPVSVHHRRPRMMGGSRNESTYIKPANLIVLCGSGTTGCHGWVESNRDRSKGAWAT